MKQCNNRKSVAESQLNHSQSTTKTSKQNLKLPLALNSLNKMLPKLFRSCCNHMMHKTFQHRSTFHLSPFSTFYVHRHNSSNISNDGIKGYAVYFYTFDVEDSDLTKFMIDKVFYDKDDALQYAKKFAPDNTFSYDAECTPEWIIPAISNRNLIEGEDTANSESPDSEFIAKFCSDNGLEKWLRNTKYEYPQPAQTIVFHRAILPDPARTEYDYNGIAISEITIHPKAPKQYCDVKSLQDVDDKEEKKNDEQEQEEDNQYKNNKNYENDNDPNNQIKEAMNMNLNDNADNDKDVGMDEMEPIEIPQEIDSGPSNVRE